jgi:lipopolysaccharide/colanic/teichoic acid biosynthesis glycosyltransferase
MAKRLLDLVTAALGLAILAIPFVVVAIAIKIESPGPLIFSQLRVGRFGRPFRMFKLRTMAQRANPEIAITVSGDPRITATGRFLRKSKLDELPQLVNILLGDMSLVGPRPEVPEFVAKYSPHDFETVLSVRPGLTDFASIRFRNENELLARQVDPVAYYEKVIIPAKLRYYRFYVHRVSVRLDLYIIMSTFVALGKDMMARDALEGVPPKDGGRDSARC